MPTTPRTNAATSASYGRWPARASARTAPAHARGAASREGRPASAPSSEQGLEPSKALGAHGRLAPSQVRLEHAGDLSSTARRRPRRPPAEEQRDQADDRGPVTGLPRRSEGGPVPSPPGIAERGRGRRSRSADAQGETSPSRAAGQVGELPGAVELSAERAVRGADARRVRRVEQPCRRLLRQAASGATIRPRAGCDRVDDDVRAPARRRRLRQRASRAAIATVRQQDEDPGTVRHPASGARPRARTAS